jgi:hypothetical protein
VSSRPPGPAWCKRRRQPDGCVRPGPQERVQARFGRPKTERHPGVDCESPSSGNFEMEGGARPAADSLNRKTMDGACLIGDLAHSREGGSDGQDGGSDILQLSCGQRR